MVLLFACHHDDPVPPDMAMPADLATGTVLSSCGHPGDKGNSLGVGKFCTVATLSDCFGPGMKTNICSALGNGPTPSPDDTYFCTIYPCKLDGGADQCGEDAVCACGGNGGGTGCACSPTRCAPPADMHP